ncbi:MAG TPA: MFS transporter [Rudaea sp.]|nr:MFS transporter [Rudaea sp.]
MDAGSGAARRDNWITVLLGADAEERAALAWSFLCFFSLLLGYYILRSVREAMIAADGTRLIPTVFTSVFVCMLALQPLYGMIVSRFPRRQFLPVVYCVVIACLVAFSFALTGAPAGAWITVAFAIFLSVINLFTDSVFWSFMSDIFVTAQARRFYGTIAAGGTAGAILGPTITQFVVVYLGVPNLLLLSACCYSVCLVCILKLVPWARAQEVRRHGQDGERPIGGSILAGFRLVVSRPLLFALVLFMFFGVSVGTLLYNQQAAVVGAMHLSSAVRTAYFARIDLGVNLVSLVVQLVLTRMLLTRFGVAPMLVIPALLAVVGLGGLTFAFSAGLVTFVQVITRGLSFSFVKPARESLFTLVDRESRYKAKNFIDTVVYRGSDVATSWSYSALASLGLGLSALAGIWTLVAIIWGIVVLWIVHLQRGISPPASEGSSHDQSSRVSA